VVAGFEDMMMINYAGISVLGIALVLTFAMRGRK
jgi:hypothetical protein